MSYVLLIERMGGECPDMLSARRARYLKLSADARAGGRVQRHPSYRMSERRFTNDCAHFYRLTSPSAHVWCHGMALHNLVKQFLGQQGTAHRITYQPNPVASREWQFVYCMKRPSGRIVETLRKHRARHFSAVQAD